MKLMKRAVFATLMSSLALASFANAAAIQDFALLDETGKFHQFSYYGDHQAIVLYAHSMDTPSLEEDLATLNNISDQGGGILVLMMNSQPAESRNAIANRAQERGSSFPVLMDDAQLVASSLGMKHLSVAWHELHSTYPNISIEIQLDRNISIIDDACGGDFLRRNFNH